MEIETHTYDEMVGGYYLKKLVSTISMNQHISEMASQGWEIQSQSVVHDPSRKRLGISGNRMIVVYKKAKKS
jgi:hypothetical protein